MVVEAPTTISGPIEFSVTGVESSQFASSLLLGAARLAARGVAASVRVEGALTSEGYFALTRSWLERVGFVVEESEHALTPTLLMGSLKPPSDFAVGRRSPSRREREIPPIPGDWSSLGYLLALSWVSGAPVERIAFGTGHPDEAIVGILRGVGLQVAPLPGPLPALQGEGVRGFDVDCELCPDSIPTLAAIATKLPAPSIFRRTGILRHKESDRLAGIRELIASTELTGDTLTVRPGPVSAFRFDAHDDHRLAMSAAVLARLHDVKLTLRGMNCVAKSFPAFWTEAAQSGLQVEEWR
jgi:3-phosphoshikimate 1-carboxyvinyltransferase